MSDELDAILSRPAPEPVEYTPMSNAYAEKEPEKEIHNSDAHGLREAAAEVDKKREEAEPIERKYIRYGGADDGKHIPLNETISINRAAEDLTRIRNQEQQEEEYAADRRFAVDADATRMNLQLTPQQIDEVIAAQDQQAQQQSEPQQQQELQPQPQAQPE